MPDDPPEPLLSHLEALRGALLRSIAGVALLVPAGCALAPAAIRGLARLCLPPEAGPLHYFGPMEAFWTQLRLGCAIAVALAFPWCAWQLWRFLLPALRPGERAAVRRAAAVSTLLFALGAAFCLLAILPLVMRFGLGFASAELRPVIGLGSFAGLCGWLLVAFGLMFQAPVAAFLLVRLGVVSAAALARARPYVIVAILVAAALLTPPDVVSQVLLAAPTWLLFELGVLLARRGEGDAASRS